MKIEELSNFSDAEKIVLAEKLWDSIQKDRISMDQSVETELDRRLEKFQNGNFTLHAWDEVKERIAKLRG